jgi:uncharacterized protein YodC (DUF2158 family)
MTTPPDFRPGDTVRLRSGSPPLTVLAVAVTAGRADGLPPGWVRLGWGRHAVLATAAAVVRAG